MRSSSLEGDHVFLPGVLEPVAVAVAVLGPGRFDHIADAVPVPAPDFRIGRVWVSGASVALGLEIARLAETGEPG